MTSTELATVEHGSTLALSAEQVAFTDRQVSALAHIGVDKASDGDLMVFFHVCQRTGLDPFARQIYMIGRQASEKDASGGWTKVTKQTIQTGIDGFRLIGRRAADRAHHSVSISAPEWGHEDGSWRPVWVKAWGYPIAARVTIQRAGEPFTAVALFDEYKQTKYSGDLTAMWEQRPAGQLAKCAEALAWRMAFPQDLSGIYSDEEMGQAHNPAPESRGGGLASVLHAEQVPDEPTFTPGRDEPPFTPGPDETPLDTSSSLARRMFAAMGNAGITEKADRLGLCSEVTGRDITSSKELTEDEASRVIDALEQATLPTAPAQAEVTS